MKLTKLKLKEMIREELMMEELFSSPEAKKVMDQSLREYAKIFRKAQY